MRLFYYTHSYPYGLGERWKYFELITFRKLFSEIVVIPFTYNNNYTACEYIEGIKYLGPLYDKFTYPNKYKMIKDILLSKFVLKFLKEFFSQKVYSNKQWAISFVITAYRIIRMLEHPTILNILKNTNRDDIHYFFWGRGISEIIQFIDKKRFKIACRFHRFDLYKEINNGYIPFQIEQIKKIELVLPCSFNGYKYIKEMSSLANCYIARLGTISEGISIQSQDGYLRIVSTAMIEPVKRVELIAQALYYTKSKIIWYHIGDGSKFQEIKDLNSKNYNTNVETLLLGKIPSKEVLNFYINNTIDLFLNVSSSEGVPVSIMEALSAGIPIYATNVGGTSEIVDSDVGLLLEPNISPMELALLLDEFANKSYSLKEKMRINAFKRYTKLCNAIQNARKLGNELLGL
jgi:colanic acid/amylovoran biosynthesis glycosyltransferase